MIRSHINFFRWQLNVENECFLVTSNCFLECVLRNFWKECTQVASLNLRNMSCLIQMMDVLFLRETPLSFLESPHCRKIDDNLYLFFRNWTIINFLILNNCIDPKKENKNRSYLTTLQWIKIGDVLLECIDRFFLQPSAEFFKKKYVHLMGWHWRSALESTNSVYNCSTHYHYCFIKLTSLSNLTQGSETKNIKNH